MQASVNDEGKCLCGFSGAVRLDWFLHIRENLNLEDPIDSDYLSAKLNSSCADILLFAAHRWPVSKLSLYTTQVGVTMTLIILSIIPGRDFWIA